MAINFAAGHMAGYNHPQITVLEFKTDPANTPISYPSYANLINLLSSGVIPVIAAYLNLAEDSGVYLVPYVAATDTGILIFKESTTTILYAPGEDVPTLVLE